MSKPLVISLPHSLGKQEAIRRIKEGLQWAKQKYGAMMTVSQEDWTDGRLTFRIGVLGQSAQGTIDVTDQDATITVQLPWLLAKFAEKAQAIVQRQGQLMLEKK